MSQATRPASAEKVGGSGVTVPERKLNLSAHLREQAFPVLAIYLCCKGIIENLSSLYILPDPVFWQKLLTRHGDVYPGAESAIALIVSFFLLALMVFFAWGEYVKEHQIPNAQAHLETLAPSSIVILAGFLGVSFR